MIKVTFVTALLAGLARAAPRWTARWRHAAVRVASGEVLVLGGHDGSLRDDVWASDAAGDGWTEVARDGARWSARWGHAAVALGNGSSVAVLGGQGVHGLLNDVWVSGSRGRSWSVVRPSGALWSARFGHVAVVLSSGTVLVMGGWDGAYRNDVWRGTPDATTWEEVVSVGQRWVGRWAHAGVVVGDRGRVMIAGGFAGGSFMGDVWLGDAQGSNWTQATSEAGRWAPRCEHQLVALGNGSVVLTGGRDRANVLTDTWLGSEDGAAWVRLATPLEPAPSSSADECSRWRAKPAVNVRAFQAFPAHTVDNTTIEVSPTVSTPTMWVGGVLAHNGKVYGIPQRAGSVLAVDPDVSTVERIQWQQSTATANLWWGGVLAPNGKIYAIPQHATTVLVIDPVTHAVDSTSVTVDRPLGKPWWTGGVLAPNGKIYGIPRDATSVLIIDPRTNATDATAMAGLSSDVNKWRGGVLAPNGRIYGIPADSAAVLVIDPAANSTSMLTLSPPDAATERWAGGVLGPNGKVYGVPYRSQYVLVIDPGTNAVNYIHVGGSGWSGGALARNGLIYCVPARAASVLIIDPDTEAIHSEVAGAGGPTESDKWRGGVLAPNGVIYALPATANTVLQIRTGLPRYSAWMEGPHFNKY